MEVIEILRQVSKQVYDNVKNLSGTEDAAGNFGRGAGGEFCKLVRCRTISF
jgi:myo-inositol-1(or 4)-monophosphatase